MAWTKSGEDRVKSYRLYRELESAYAKVMEENEKLKETLRVKDDLIRRLAHEVATLPVAEATAPVRSMAAGSLQHYRGPQVGYDSGQRGRGQGPSKDYGQPIHRTS